MFNFLKFIREEKYTPVEGTQAGSNEGGIHTDSKGGKHYIKYYKNGDQGKVEALTSKIYHHMGIHTLNPEHEKINGKHAVRTKFNDKLESMHGHDFENLNKKQAHQIGRMYHGAVLTKNWDVVGLVHDNIMRHKETGDLHSIDTGGSFHFRAQGKPKEYGPDIAEHKSLRSNSDASGHVFSHVFQHHPEAERAGLDAVKKIDDNHVHGLFKNSGLSNWKELHHNFQERKKKLLAHYRE
jgi:hypothetical protein